MIFLLAPFSKIQVYIICCFCSFLTLSLNLTLIMPIFEHKKQEGIFPLTWPLNLNQQIAIIWFSQTFLCVCLLVSIFPLRPRIHLQRLKSWTASFYVQTLYKQYHSRKAVKPYLYYLELKNVEIYCFNVLNFFPKSDGGHCEYCLSHTKTHLRPLHMN